MTVCLENHVWEIIVNFVNAKKKMVQMWIVTNQDGDDIYIRQTRQNLIKEQKLGANLAVVTEWLEKEVQVVATCKNLAPIGLLVYIGDDLLARWKGSNGKAASYQAIQQQSIHLNMNHHFCGVDPYNEEKIIRSINAQMVPYVFGVLSYTIPPPLISVLLCPLIS